MSRRRAELLELAERLLEDEGMDAFGLGALARAAGIRPPSLYKHFAGLADLEHLLISRGFFRFADALNAEQGSPNQLADFARAYRTHAFAHPQLYRLMTERPLDRELLSPGAEQAAMVALLRYFDESPQAHDRARAAWAAAHGLIALELAGRFPPGTDIDAAWAVYVSAFTR